MNKYWIKISGRSANISSEDHHHPESMHTTTLSQCTPPTVWLSSFFLLHTQATRIVIWDLDLLHTPLERQEGVADSGDLVRPTAAPPAKRGCALAHFVNLKSP